MRFVGGAEKCLRPLVLWGLLLDRYGGADYGGAGGGRESGTGKDLRGLTVEVGVFKC